MAEHDAATSYDPLSPSTLDDPFPGYAQLRDACPMHRSESFEQPLYSLSRAADVHALFTDPDLWSSRYGGGVGTSNALRGDISRFDPPEHIARRKFARTEFTPTRVAALAPGTAVLANRLIDDLLPRGEAELHDDFALLLPIIAFIDMLGVPQEDRTRIKAWADGIVLGLADPAAAAEPTRQVQDYVSAMVDERRAAADAAGMPGEEAVGTVVPPGLLSTYALRLFEGERLPVKELRNMILQLLVAGHETTTSLITNMTWRLLLERERLWDAVVANHALIENAVEESLRFDPPVLGLCRTNETATTLLGEELAPDTKVMAIFASANRDPEVFSDPETFRLDRDMAEASRHYSFGWGTHHCLGARLARQTAAIALEALVTRMPTLHIAGETERIAPAFLWGRRRLPVAW